MTCNGMRATLSLAAKPNLACLASTLGGWGVFRGYLQYPLPLSKDLAVWRMSNNKKKRPKQQPGNNGFVFKCWFILLWIYRLSLVRISRTRAVQESVKCYGSPAACTASLMLGTTSPCQHCPRNFKPKRPWVKSFIWSFYIILFYLLESWDIRRYQNWYQQCNFFP